MKKTLLMAVLLMLTVGCSEKTEEPSSSTQTNSSAKATFVAESAVEKEIVRSCVDNMQQQVDGKISSENVDKICLCSLSGIREKYSVAEMEGLDNASEEKKMAFMRDSLTAAMDCAVKFQKGQL